MHKRRGLRRLSVRMRKNGKARRRLSGIRSDRRQSARRASGARDDDALVSKAGQQADHAGRRRDVAHRRPVGQGQTAPVHDARNHRAQHRGAEIVLREVHSFRRRGKRRDRRRQLRLVQGRQLSGLFARRRDVLLRQPHADDGKRQNASGTRTADDVSGIQLPAAAGVRFLPAV